MEIITAHIAYTCLKDLMTEDVEEFWALALGPKKNLIKSKMIFRGTVDSCLVHPRDIFRFACTENASSLIVAHSHPSGDPEPSDEDILFTRTLVRAAGVMQIPVLDHLIVTKKSYSSLAQNKWCEFKVSDRTFL